MNKNDTKNQQKTDYTRLYSGDRRTAVVFDLDDTLINFCETFCRWMQFTHQLDEIDTEFTDYDLMAPFHANLKDPDTTHWLLEFEKSGCMDNVSFTPLIDLFKQYIASPLHRVIIITARGWMQTDPVESVRRLMDRLDIPRDAYDVFVSNHGESKASLYAREVDNFLEAVYDDVIGNLTTFEARFPKAKLFCPARPWNANAPFHIQRIPIGDLFTLSTQGNS